MRSSATAVFDALLMQTTAQAEAALARIKAGEDPETVAMDVNAARPREVNNPAKWREGQQGHVRWLYRRAVRRGRRP
ncbi:MAG: hypothetical protein KDK29_21400, partial [Sedimentitalea sp.]|nr:hypothetical protein [Sedimentitalea sp.]